MFGKRGKVEILHSTTQTKAQEIVPLLVDSQSKVCPTNGGSPLRSGWNYRVRRNKPGQRRGDVIKVIFI